MDSRISPMRTPVTLIAVVMLTACVPLQIVQNGQMGTRLSDRQGWSSSASSSAASSEEVELTGEIEEESSSSAETSTGALIERATNDGFLLLGDAPGNVLTVFTNYGCDYCEEFSRDMLPRLIEEFVATGDMGVQIVIVPLKKYPNSALEASALFCAAKEGKGVAMHDELTAATTRDRKSIALIAKRLALSAAFTKCLDSKETKATLVTQQGLIAEHGVTLIPEFLLGSEKKTGLPSYADLRGWIRSRSTGK